MGCSQRCLRQRSDRSIHVVERRHWDRLTRFDSVSNLNILTSESLDQRRLSYASPPNDQEYAVRNDVRILINGGLFRGTRSIHLLVCMQALLAYRWVTINWLWSRSVATLSVLVVPTQRNETEHPYSNLLPSSRQVANERIVLTNTRYQARLCALYLVDAQD